MPMYGSVEPHKALQSLQHHQTKPYPKDGPIDEPLHTTTQQQAEILMVNPHVHSVHSL